MFWRLNVRILDWERLLLYHQELDNYLYLIILIFFTRRPVLVYGEIYLSVTVFTSVRTSGLPPTSNPAFGGVCVFYEIQRHVVFLLFGPTAAERLGLCKP